MSLKIWNTDISKMYMWVDEPGREPWANTLVYYKFSENLDDSSWNGNNGTNNGNNVTYTQWTVGYYVNGDNSQIQTPLTQAQVFNSNFTISVWMREDGSNSLYRLFRKDSSTWIDIQYEFYNDFSWIQIYLNSSNTRIAFPFSNPWQWNWVHIVFTWDWVNQVKCYANWMEIQPYPNYNTTFTYNGDSTLFAMWDTANTAMSWDELIIENKTRTAQEVADYFDLYKGDYWIV